MTTRSKKKSQQTKLWTELDEILRRVDLMRDLDSRTPDEIIGYDENGLPQSGERERGRNGVSAT